MLPCRCGESNPGPVEKQPVLLTVERSLQPVYAFNPHTQETKTKLQECERGREEEATFLLKQAGVPLAYIS